MKRNAISADPMTEGYAGDAGDIHPIYAVYDDRVVTPFLDGAIDMPEVMKRTRQIFGFYEQQRGSDGDAAALESTRRELFGREPIRVGINPERARLALHGRTGEVRRAKRFDAAKARAELCRR